MLGLFVGDDDIVGLMLVGDTDTNEDVSGDGVLMIGLDTGALAGGTPI